VCSNLGCSFFVYPKTTFIIENASSHDIDISIYEKSALIETVEIRAGSEFERELKDKSNELISPFRESSDSLVVKFGKNKALVFYCNGSQLTENECIEKYFAAGKNPMVLLNEEESINKLSGYRTYTLTYDNSDYERAAEL
jgi:hypothetical protein